MEAYAMTKPVNDMPATQGGAARRIRISIGLATLLMVVILMTTLHAQEYLLTLVRRLVSHTVESATMSTLDAVDDGSFRRRVIESSRPVLVLFTAPGCQPCEMQARWLPLLAAELGSTIDIVHCSVDVAPRAAGAHSVLLVPNLTLFDRGRSLDSHVGILPLPSIRTWMQVLLTEARTTSSLPAQNARDERWERARIFARTFFRRLRHLIDQGDIIAPATTRAVCEIARSCDEGSR